MTEQSERPSASSLEVAGVMLAEVDDSGRLTFISPELEAALQRPASELLGTPLDAHLCPRREHLDEVQLQGPGGPGPWYLRRRLPKPEGGSLEVLVDITARRTRERALEAFEECLEYSPDAVFWLDRDGRFSYVNQQACESLGYHHDELIGLGLADIDPDYASRAFRRDWALYDSMPEGGMRTLRIDTFHRRKDGTSFPVEVIVRHRREEEGHLHAAFVRDASAWRQAERRLYFMDAALERASTATFWAGPDARLFHVNEAACQMLGYSREELLGMCIYDVDPEYPPGAWSAFWSRLREHRSIALETTHRRKDGVCFPVEVISNYVTYEGEEFCFGFVRSIADEKAMLAERAHLEAQLHQAHKMEAIGRLAGGVAHDFNNMLGVILGYSEMLREDLQDRPVAVEGLLEIERAAQRSRDTTRQLLAFSRRQAIEPRVLDLNRQVREAERSIMRLIREDIRFGFDLEPKLWRVSLDPSQLDQILVNLVVNARDAMPQGGLLWVETGNVESTSALADGGRGPELPPGEYVRLTVRDDGAGMAEDVVANAFEPFFTTKGRGRGTGLGLATVYGIVEQNGGHIKLESQLGVGTRVDIFLPRTEAPMAALEPFEPTADVVPDKTVLVVEDEPALLRITAEMLRDLGYRVVVTSSAFEALKMCGPEGVAVDLVVSDVVMPEMHGPALEEALAAVVPGLQFLFISGYAADVTARSLLRPGARLLQKPFSKRELAREVRRALTSP